MDNTTRNWIQANNRIDEWIQNGNTYKALDLSNLELTNLPPIPDYVIELNCQYNELLTSLPDLPHTLRRLYIYGTPNLKLTRTQIKFLIDNDVNIDVDLDRIPILEEPTELKLETTYPLDNVNCNNTSHFDGDDLAFVNKILILLTPTNYILYCFQRDELFDALTHSDPVFVWRDDKINRPDWVGEPDRNQRVYKEPYSGLWLTSDSLTYLEIYNVLVLTQLYPAKLGTGEDYWVSRMHGTDEDIHMLYTLYPVNYKLISDKSKITQRDIKSFIPTREDIDIMYTNNPDKPLIISENKITSPINNLIIEWNENVRTDKVNDKTLVFRKL